jgi:putative N-acetyltransferase (TIGR04045 family)
VPGVSSRSSVARELSPTACRVASCADELDAHFALRRAVFAREQRLFASDDRDERDGQPETLHAIGLIGAVPCGAVRLYPLDPAGEEWQGDRLAVLAAFRSHRLGAELVRFAVATAGARGGRRMVAHIQLPNVRFFTYLGWEAHGTPELFRGIDHQLMSIGLSPEPPRWREET